MLSNLLRNPSAPVMLCESVWTVARQSCPAEGNPLSPGQPQSGWMKVGIWICADAAQLPTAPLLSGGQAVSSAAPVPLSLPAGWLSRRRQGLAPLGVRIAATCFPSLAATHGDCAKQFLSVQFSRFAEGGLHPAFLRRLGVAFLFPFDVYILPRLQPFFAAKKLRTQRLCSNTDKLLFAG